MLDETEEANAEVIAEYAFKHKLHFENMTLYSTSYQP